MRTHQRGHCRELDDLRTRLDKIEKHQEDSRDKYVTMAHFDAVIIPIQKSLGEIRNDIKDVLRAVSQGRSHGGKT